MSLSQEQSHEREERERKPQTVNLVQRFGKLVLPLIANTAALVKSTTFPSRTAPVRNTAEKPDDHKTASDV